MPTQEAVARRTARDHENKREEHEAITEQAEYEERQDDAARDLSPLERALQAALEARPEISQTAAIRTARCVKLYQTINAIMWNRAHVVRTLYHLDDPTLAAVETFAEALHYDKDLERFIAEVAGAAGDGR